MLLSKYAVFFSKFPGLVGCRLTRKSRPGGSDQLGESGDIEQGDHILEKSLNFNGNFGRSLKSAWIFKMILEILEFRVRYDLPLTFPQIVSATLPLYNFFWHVITFFRGFLVWGHIVIPDHRCFRRISTALKITERSFNYPWILAWEFCGHPVEKKIQGAGGSDPEEGSSPPPRFLMEEP